MGRNPSPPDEASAARIRSAVARRAEAEDELRAAVVDAVRRGGGSERTVAEIAGLSRNTVQRWLAQ